MRIVGGELRGRRLLTPTGDATRPTTDRDRETLFNILAHHDWGAAALEGALTLDAFCGTGALALEALSRGVARAVLFDVGAGALRVARDNVVALGVADRVEVRRADATKPPKATAPASLITLDPPYGKGLASRALLALDAAGWCKTGTVAVVEEAQDAPFEAPQVWEMVDDRQRRGTRLRFLIHRG